MGDWLFWLRALIPVVTLTLYARIARAKEFSLLSAWFLSTILNTACTVRSEMK